MLDPHGLSRDFICPAQAAVPLEIFPQHVWMYISLAGPAFQEPQSFIYNEYVLGWDDNYGHLKGKASLIRKPAQTFFAADGIAGSTAANHGGHVISTLGMYTVYNMTTANPVTLADAYASRTGYAGDKQNFDLKRHNKRLNVAFCDGHVENRKIDAGGLSNIYIVAP